MKTSLFSKSKSGRVQVKDLLQLRVQLSHTKLTQWPTLKRLAGSLPVSIMKV
jgi:hypothetical protein